MTSNLLEKCASIVFIPCFDKILHDNNYILAIRRKLEFVFRINHNIKRSDVDILYSFYFLFMDYYTTFQRKE